MSLSYAPCSLSTVRGCSLRSHARSAYGHPTQLSLAQGRCVARVVAQAVAEESRKSFRNVYDYRRWQHHRNPYRLIAKFLSTPKSNIYKNIIPSVVWVTGMATFAALFDYLGDLGLIPANLLSALPTMLGEAASNAFLAQTAVALSLLLVFRTNSAYARWDEARKMWAGLLQRSRDLLRQADTLMPNEYWPAKSAFARWTIVFAYLLHMQLQPDDARLEGKVAELLGPAERKMLDESEHKPTKAIHMLSQIVASTPLPPAHHWQLNSNITQLHDVLGNCERILTTPIPVAYTRHTSFFFFLWLNVLPFALADGCGLFTIPACFAIAVVVCGIDEIGIQCEEPFGVLPLTDICQELEFDVVSTLALEQGRLSGGPAGVQVPEPVQDSAVPHAVHGNGNGNGNGTAAWRAEGLHHVGQKQQEAVGAGALYVDEIVESEGARWSNGSNGHRREEAGEGQGAYEVATAAQRAYVRPAVAARLKR